MEWEPIQLSSSLDSLGLSSATSSEIFSVNAGGGVMLVKTSGLPLTVSPPLTVTPTPTPSPSCDPALTTCPSPEPAPTVTVTQTVAPAGPSEVSGTVKLDGEQFAGLTVGMVLILLFVVAAAIAQLRRP